MVCLTSPSWAMFRLSLFQLYRYVEIRTSVFVWFVLPRSVELRLDYLYFNFIVVWKFKLPTSWFVLPRLIELCLDDVWDILTARAWFTKQAYNWQGSKFLEGNKRGLILIMWYVLIWSGCYTAPCDLILGCNDFEFVVFYCPCILLLYFKLPNQDPLLFLFYFIFNNIEWSI